MGQILSETNEGANLWMELNSSSDDMPPPPNVATSSLNSNSSELSGTGANRNGQDERPFGSSKDRRAEHPKRRRDDKPSGARVLDELNPMTVLAVGVAGLLVAIAFVFMGGSANGTTTFVADPTETTLQSGPPRALALSEQATTTTASTLPQVPVALLDESQLQMLRLYRSAFGRNPDSSGFAYWSDQLRSGVPLITVAEAFVASEEFVTADSDGELVATIYRNATADVPSPENAAAFLEILQTGTPADLLIAVSEAPETVTFTGTGSEMVAAMESDS